MSSSSTARARLDEALRYVLVTPARNEAEYIELTIKSVVAQTVQPMKWVIVSDGSTDATDAIVAKWAADHPWIDLVRMPERRERNFAAKARAFNVARARLSDLPYEAIANLDADVSFGPDHFEFLLDKLGNDPALGVVGTAFEDRSLRYDYRYVSIEHVTGPCQLFRRACMEAIDGYVASKAGGVDHIAVIRARMQGWKTRTFTERTFVHHRLMGTASRGVLAARYKSGRLDYLLGSHPLWEIFRTIYQMRKPPYVVGALWLLAGYISAAVGRVERPVTPELVRFRQREQMQRLKARFARKNVQQAPVTS
jgi:glycosyltransferase involved in cell wall biosynthesis